MKVSFNLLYNSTWDNNNYPLEITEGRVIRPLFIKWKYKTTDYEFVRDDKDFILSIYVSQEKIIVCYDKDSLSYPHPHNLVVYNLKKEVVQIITTPKPISWKLDLAAYSIGKIVQIEGKEHISVYIGVGDLSGNILEQRFLNLETFEFHPTEHTSLENHRRRI